MTNPANIPQEVELKLEVEPENLDNVLAHPLLNGKPGDTARSQTLYSTYFDTPDHALRQAGISLRIRRNGARRIQTIKAAPKPGSIVMARSEWEHEVESDEPDFDAAAETAIEPFITLREFIRPVFAVSVERALRELSYGSSVIELAADRGQIQGKERANPFSEIELELKDGTPDDLFGLALALSKTTPLRLSFTTKSERGYEVDAAEIPKRVKAPSVDLKRRMKSAQAFQVIGTSCLQHLMANEAIVRKAREGDAVHQMRVALRRLRAAVALFKSVVEDEERDRIKAELKWMANLLGEARDLDVYIEKVLEPARVQHESDANYTRLLADYQQHRDKAYEKVQETIASSRFSNGILATAAWIQAGDWLMDGSRSARVRRKQPVPALAEEELGRRWKRILKRGRNLAELDPEERHQVRIEIKKLRYATEFFESLFKGKGMKKKRRAALDTLEAFQETLGELNDIAVSSGMDASPAAEAIHKEQIARVDAFLDAAEAHYREFASLEPFWKS
jgi:inorganic triphosphatase YgiF